MPSVNIYTNEKNAATLKLILNELRLVIAKELSGKERILDKNEVSIRVIVSEISSQIAEIELLIIAHSYAERVLNQDKICLKIKNFLTSKVPSQSIYVWLQLSELGHSA